MEPPEREEDRSNLRHLDFGSGLHLIPVVRMWPGQSRVDPLADDRSLEVGEYATHLEHRLSGGERGVDAAWRGIRSAAMRGRWTLSRVHVGAPDQFPTHAPFTAQR